MLRFSFLDVHDALQGVCIGLNEVMGSAGKSQLLIFMDDLIPTIRTALCDRFVTASGGYFLYNMVNKQ